MFEGKDRLEELYDITHGALEGEPECAFVEYCEMLLKEYRSGGMSSEVAGQALTRLFNPEVSFRETRESKEIKDFAADLELGDVGQLAGAEDESWDRIEELLALYAEKVGY
jgi:hypothetical protein